jgi:hypothetical protein
MTTRERPILFSAPMVRAILEGRKTQTRRVMNPQPVKVSGGVPFRPLPPSLVGVADPAGGVLYRSRFGKPCDRLWVRETWGLLFDNDPDEQPTFWRADYTPEDERTSMLPSRWRPSIHMPRARSRIDLEVTGVRVERLQDISQADCVAEGMPESTNGFLHHVVADYRKLWSEINGAESWAANPWVWVVEFRRMP